MKCGKHFMLKICGKDRRNGELINQFSNLLGLSSPHVSKAGSPG